MADHQNRLAAAQQHSSPSTITSSNSGNNTPKSRSSNSSGNDETLLVIRKQPPRYVFSEEEFAIEFGLETSASKVTGRLATPQKQAASGHETEFKVTLESAATPVSASARGSSSTTINDGTVLIVVEEPRLPATRKTGTVRCRIHYGKKQVPRTGAAFCIKLQSKDDASNGVQPVTTAAVQLVNAKLRVSTAADWSNIWYKDEGGRDKSMEVLVEAVDRYSNLLRERVPLALTLCYNSTDRQQQKPVQVTNQEILRSLGSDRKLQIDKTTGTAKVRFRIEDVSKNHQGQDFSIEIAADRKIFSDIAPGYTPAVSVRSKRNKRQRASTSSGSGRGPTTGGSMERGLSPSGQGRQSSYGESSMPLEGGDAGRLSAAMHGVLQWTEEVVHGLYPLQWQVLGYSQHPDGSPDYNRPYHSMQNPNPVIARVLSMYSESTRDHLRVLQQAVDQTAGTTNPSRDDVATSGYASVPPAAAAPQPYMMSQSPPSLQAPSTQPQRMPPPPQPQQGPPIRGMPAEHAGVHFGGFASMPPSQQGPPPAQSATVAGTSYYRPHRMDNPDATIPLPASLQPPQQLRRQGAAKHPPPVSGSPHDMDHHHSHLESEVEYVLAKQYKSARTGDRLGFPAYSISKEILGFYRESSKAGSRFVPIHQHAAEFGPAELLQATEILNVAIHNKSEAVHALKDWGSIANLVDHVLVYDWSKDIGTESSQPQQASGALTRSSPSSLD